MEIHRLLLSLAIKWWLEGESRLERELHGIEYVGSRKRFRDEEVMVNLIDETKPVLGIANADSDVAGLYETVLGGVDLTAADLRKASLSRAYLGFAKLAEAGLWLSVLEEANERRTSRRQAHP